MIETNRRATRGAALLAAALVLTAAPAAAQSTATLQGTVTDAQGAAVPGATVVARNAATGVERTTVTDTSGYYQLPSLPVGLFRVQVSAPGFQTQVASDLRLEVANIAVQNFQLKVGGVTEETTSARCRTTSA